MFDWENLRHLVAVAQAGTLSGAARALGVDHATVSRRLGALEAELQMPLVERLPRACRLSAQGLQVLELARDMETAAFGIERLARASQMPLAGRISLSAPPVLVAHFLARHLAGLRRAHPHIELSLLADSRQVSLSRREADLALRLVRPSEPSHVARRIGRMPFALYAHKSYAARTAAPDWSFIAYDHALDELPQQQWLREVAGDRPISCRLSDISGQLAAALAGAGVAGLPCFIADAQPELLRLEHAGRRFEREIWLLVHRDLRRSGPVRIVMEHVAALVAQTPMLALD